MMSKFLANNLLNGILRQVPYQSPNPCWLALLQAPPASGEPLEEVTTRGTNEEQEESGYKRPPLEFSAARSQRAYTSKMITFPTAREIWATTLHPVTSVAIMDAPTGGNFLWAADLAAPARILKGSRKAFLPTAIKVWFNNRGIFISDYMAHVILNGVLRNQQFDPPEKTYLALLHTLPKLNKPSIKDMEMSANVTSQFSITGPDSGYARQEISWAEVEDGWALNDEKIAFPVPEEDWIQAASGLVADQPDQQLAIVNAIMDAERDGNWLFAFPMEARAVNKGAVPITFAPKEIKVMLDENTI